MVIWQYWRWFFFGINGGKPGLRRIANTWMLVHLSAGLAAAMLVTINVRDAANTVLLPLAGIFVGLSFAWSGNAQALLQSHEIELLSEFSTGGLEEYVYTFQTAILTILATLVMWGAGGLGIYDRIPLALIPGVAIETALYTMASITLRECWHVVWAAQALLLARYQVAKLLRQQKSPLTEELNHDASIGARLTDQKIGQKPAKLQKSRQKERARR